MSEPLTFLWNEADEEYQMEIKGVKFICETMQEGYEQLAHQLAEEYDRKLSALLAFLLPEVLPLYSSLTKEELKEALHIPIVDLDNQTITYAEHTLDDEHVIVVEFQGLFDEFYEVIVDG